MGIHSSPPENGSRLDALRATTILDTPRERDFDDIVAYVADLCDVPVCLISLVEDERQWFKAAQGLDVRETPINQSICLHALAEEEILEIPDTSRDPRTSGNSLCQGPNALKFYAGALLRLSGGTAIGTLCVLDRRPRRLDAHQRRTMVLLARQVVRQIELHEALSVQKRLQDEIDHRVKNSLQMVASYLRMQRRGARPEAVEVLLQAEQRVAAVSALHAALNDTGGNGSVALGPYLARIAELLNGSLPENVSVEVDIAPARLPPERAAALGLIVNEFVTNSVKHAFPDYRAGRVRVTGRFDGTSYELSMQDDGIGFALQEAGGLGLSIIEAAAQQLQASTEWPAATAGTALRTRFSAELDEMPLQQSLAPPAE